MFGLPKVPTRRSNSTKTPTSDITSVFEEVGTASPPALDPPVTNGIAKYTFDSQEHLI
jgi:hypothetical protein